MTRTRRLAAMVLLVLGVIGGALELARGMAASPVPGVAYGLPMAVTPDAGRGVGANVDLVGRSREDADRALAAMTDHGLAWARQTFSWATIEPEPGVLNWEASDVVVDAIDGAGLRLVAVLGASPAWARPPGQETAEWSPPGEYAAFGDFAAAFARRYGDRVDFYQIWDQPNIYPYWGDRYVDPEAYGRLVREAASRIRAEDADAVILLAGLAPNVETGPLNLNEPEYLRRLLASGAGPYFDVAAVKAYGFEEAADDYRLAANVLNFSRAALVHQVLVDAGRADTPIWAAEFGWNALPPEWSGRPAPWGTGDADAQAARVLAAAARARAEWPWMGPMVWSRLAAPDDADDPAYGFALLEADLTPTALGRLLLPALAADVAPALGWHAPDSAWARYSSGWRVTPQGADPSAAGDSVTIAFQGTALDLLLAPGPYWATWSVEVDGERSAALPAWKDHSYAVLYDPLGQARRVTVAAALPSGVHEATIAVDGGWGQWPLLGWVSWRQAPAGPKVPVLALCSAAALAGLLLLRADRLLRFILGYMVKASERVPEPAFALSAAALLAVFWLSAGLIPSVLAGFGLAVLAVAAPQWLLTASLASLPFFLVPKSALGVSLMVPEILSWLLLIGAALRNWVTLPWPAVRLRVRALDAGVALLVVAAAAATWAAPMRGVAVHDFRRVILSAAALYAGTRLVGRPALWPALIGVLAGASVASAAGIGQYLRGENLITAGEVARVRAWYGSPNNLALYLGRAIPLGLALTLFSRAPRVRWPGAAALVLCLACGILTRSRGLVLLGLPVSGAWLLWQSGWLRKSRGAIVAIVAAAALVVVSLAGGRLDRLVSGQDEAAGMRLHLWTSAAQMVRDHPVLGVGPDNFLYQYRTRYITPEAWAEPNLSHPHNVVFDFWLTAGAGGLLALAVMAVGAIRRGRRALGEALGEETGAYLGIVAALMAAVAQGLVDNSFFLVDLSHVTLVLLALLANPIGAGSRADGRHTNLAGERII